MLALPLKPGVGVKVAVRLKPLPLTAPSVPPVTLMSPVLPSQSKPTGSSVKVKVMLAVCPLPKSGLSLLMVMVGASVSMLRIGVVAAAPGFPAASV